MCASYFLLSSPKSSSSGRQPQFMGWPLEAPPKPVRVAAIFGFLGDSCQVALVRAQIVTELGLDGAPSRRLQRGRAPLRAAFEDDTAKGQTRQAL